MKILAQIRQSDIFPDMKDNSTRFEHRKAVRAIVTDEQVRLALLKVGNHNYHKLPGGGIEEGEDIEAALRREIREEIGCEVEVKGELGQIIEYRDAWSQKQTSYCYMAGQIGAIAEPDFAEEELADGFEMVWASDIDAAIALLDADRPDNYVGAFIRARDMKFLRAAKNL